MKKPKYVYHGSGKKLKGKKLVPKKATDLEENPDNLLVGVYASDLKDEAIAMGILSCKGVRGSSSKVDRKHSKKVEAIIYNGWPQQDYFYLYTLPSTAFENRPRGSNQYVSLISVEPKEVKKLAVKDYIHLVRKATEEEKKEWFRKYAHKLKKR